MNYTDEQLDIANEIKISNTNKIIAVNAIAGSGKTSVCNLIVDTVKPKKGFYTAFNRAIVEDANKKFGDKILCKTMHALAYQYANREKKKIIELTYKDINNVETIKDKSFIIEVMEDFFLSSYLDYNLYAEDMKIEKLNDEILFYMDKMLNGEMNPTFSFLLKKFHLMLFDKEVEPVYDLFLYDEAQDITGVMLEILKLINAKKKVILGDKYQNIYSFMNTINAFEELDSSSMHQFKLTNCFRCQSDIGNRVEAYGSKALESWYRFNGVMPKSDTIETRAYLSKLNANLIRRMHTEIANNNTFSLIRDVNSIFEFPLAMENASKDREVYSKKYRYLQDIRDSKNIHGMEFLEYLTDDQIFDDQTVYTAELVMEYENQGISLYKLREDIRKMIPNKKYILSSIHAFKGLEADEVFLDSDISMAVDKILNNKKYHGKDPEYIRSIIDSKDKETLNLMYVGMSRAKHVLRNAYC